MKSNRILLLPVMLCFFAMGFVDLVGIASNYVKADLGLTDSVANIFPSLVFFWFLIFSIPTSVLMNRIGRKRTVLLSLAVTVVSLLMPLFGESFAVMLLSFSLLGIGNALMQTSLNPLVTQVINGGHLASTLTFGQFIKAIASFLAPYLALWGATSAIPSFNLGWRVLFLIYFVVGVLAAFMLAAAPIKEEPTSRGTSFGKSLVLLRTPVILLSFIGIMCHVGIDVGTNTTAPKILMERLGWSLNDAAFSTSLYFIFRTFGCLSGALLLRKMKSRTFYVISCVLLSLGVIGLVTGNDHTIIYASIALIGYGDSNLFSIIFARALDAVPDKKNEVSGLMIMGLFGGTVFPLLMGFASDAAGQTAAVGILAAGAVYLLGYTRRINN